MSNEQREAFLAAFASIPQRVIWKFEKPIENAPKNVMISKWIPQRDILGRYPDIVFFSTVFMLDAMQCCSDQTPERFPQNLAAIFYVIEHKNVIAFMSHCGLSGVFEAVATGTPVVAIPLFTDQPSNAALLCYRGAAVYLNFRTVTKEKILAALNTIVNDTR